MDTQTVELYGGPLDGLRVAGGGRREGRVTIGRAANGAVVKAVYVRRTDSEEPYASAPRYVYTTRETVNR